MVSVGVIAAALGCILAGQATTGQTTVPATPRVRTENPTIAALVQQGAARSPTFRDLLSTIDNTDGIVWVQEGECQHSVHACLLLSVKIAGPSRLLRVLITTKGENREVIAALGHELRHAIEVLGQPSIRSGSAMYLFYQHEGPTNSGRFETEAAVFAGLAVREELGRKH